MEINVDKKYIWSRECGNPKLKSFGGKAKDFSPRARVR